MSLISNTLHFDVQLIANIKCPSLYNNNHVVYIWHIETYNENCHFEEYTLANNINKWIHMIWRGIWDLYYAFRKIALFIKYEQGTQVLRTMDISYLDEYYILIWKIGYSESMR